MTKKELFSILDHPKILLEKDLRSLKDLAEKYPYCSVYQMMLAKKMQVENHDDFQKHLNLTATITPDRKALFNYLKTTFKAQSKTATTQSEKQTTVKQYQEDKHELVSSQEDAQNELDSSTNNSQSEEPTKYNQVLENTVAVGSVLHASAENSHTHSEQADTTHNLDSESTVDVEASNTIPETDTSEDVGALQENSLETKEIVAEIKEASFADETANTIVEEYLTPENIAPENNQEITETDNDVFGEGDLNEPLEETSSIESLNEETIEPIDESENDIEVIYEEVLLPEEFTADSKEESEGHEETDNTYESVPETLKISETETEVELTDNIIADIDPESVQPIPDDEIIPIHLEQQTTEDTPEENSILDFTGLLNTKSKNDTTESIASIHEIMFLTENDIPYEDSDNVIRNEEEEENMSFSDWLNKGKPVHVPQKTDNEDDSLPMIKVKKRKKKMKKKKKKANKTKKTTSVKNKDVKKKKAKKIKKKKKSKIKVIAKTSVSKNEDIIAENLASILVDQGKIKEAKAMYKKLILKFPEKSTFFAEKLKDLKK